MGSCSWASSSFAGELGHHIIDPSGPQCRRPRLLGGICFWNSHRTRKDPSECLPSQVSYQNWSQPDAGVNAKHVFEAKRLQDPVAVEVIDRAIYYMALGLVNVIHSFNPDRIVIGGV